MRVRGPLGLLLVAGISAGVVACEPDGRVEFNDDLGVGRHVEVVDHQDEQRLADGFLVVQHRTEHALLGLDVLRRQASRQFVVRGQCPSPLRMPGIRPPCQGRIRARPCARSRCG